MPEGTRRLLRILVAVASSASLGVPAHAGWVHEYLDPPDSVYTITHDVGLVKVLIINETRARARCYVASGFINSNFDYVEAQETTIERYTWQPSAECPSGYFSWNGYAEVVGRLSVVSPPASSSGLAYALSVGGGFGKAHASGSGDTASSTGPGGSVTVKAPGIELGAGASTTGNGGGTGFSDIVTHDGDSKCITAVTVEKTKYAQVQSWAGSRWIPPEIGAADGDVRAIARCEQQPGEGCCNDG